MKQARSLLLLVLADAQRELLTKRTWVDGDSCTLDGCKQVCDTIHKASEQQKYCYKACDNEMCGYPALDRRDHCESFCKKASGHKKHKNDCQSGCDFWCSAKSVTGHWDYLETVSKEGTATYKHGRYESKGTSVTETKSWSQSAASAMGNGAFSFKGPHSHSVSGSIGGSLSKTYTKEFAQWSEVTWTVNFKKEDVGKAIYQFDIDIEDNCGNKASYETQDYALVDTAKFDEPCCLPKYATDVPEYQNCKSGSPSVCASLSNLTLV
jgi:hypothetical protein